MQFAKTDGPAPDRRWRPIGDSFVAARDASDEEEAKILRLTGQAMLLHRHADWRHLSDWIGSPGSVVYERGALLLGYLAATPDPPPVAWIRTLAIASSEPEPILEAMLAHATARLQPLGVNKFACMAAADWLEEALPRQRFTAEQQVETLLKRHMDPIDWPEEVNKLDIVPGDTDDLNELAKIDQAAFDNPLWWHSATQLLYAARQALNFDVAWVDGRIAGYVYGARSAGRRAHIVRIAVWPRFQGRGIGRCLLTHTINSYRQQGIRAISLNTQHDNSGARRLYERFGFNQTGEHYNVWTRALTENGS